MTLSEEQPELSPPHLHHLSRGVVDGLGGESHPDGVPLTDLTDPLPTTGPAELSPTEAAVHPAAAPALLPANTTAGTLSELHSELELLEVRDYRGGRVGGVVESVGGQVLTGGGVVGCSLMPVQGVSVLEGDPPINTPQRDRPGPERAP